VPLAADGVLVESLDRFLKRRHGGDQLAQGVGNIRARNDCTSAWIRCWAASRIRGILEYRTGVPKHAR